MNLILQHYVYSRSSILLLVAYSTAAKSSSSCCQSANQVLLLFITFSPYFKHVKTQTGRYQTEVCGPRIGVSASDTQNHTVCHSILEIGEIRGELLQLRDSIPHSTCPHRHGHRLPVKSLVALTLLPLLEVTHV